VPEYNPLKRFAKKALRNGFDFIMKVQNTPRERHHFYAIGNSHLDAAWKWRVLQTMSKAKFTFKNALKNMANYEEYTFSQSTPQFYEWMKDRHPRIFRAIQDQVRGRHWEIVGGMWVEPDGNLPDGESLVRQRLYGQRFYLNHFGRISEIEWLPDTFGYAWTLPQILAKSGAKYFWTTKLLWNDTTKFPFSTFLWRGPDGSEVLTYISPLSGLSLLHMHNFKKTNRLVNFHRDLVADYATRPGDIRAKLSRDTIPEIGVFYGVGDGGGGPTELEIEAVRALHEAGYVQMSRSIEFFRKLDAYRDRLPVWNDELYLEFHRGCYTTQGATKNANRRAELALRNVEIVHSMNSLFGKPYPGEQIREHWKTALFNQFHDILPGSSIPEVYEDALEEYESMFSSVYDLIKSGMGSISRRIRTENPKLPDTTPLIVYNTASWRRTTTAFLRLKETERKVCVYREDGTEVPSQVINMDGHPTLAFLAEEIPDLGYRTYFMGREAPATKGYDPMVRELEDGGFELENEFITAVIDGQTGAVTSLVLKETGRELLAEPSHVFRLYREDNRLYPAWNIDKNYQKKEVRLSPPSEAPRIEASGPMGATIEYTQPLGNGSSALVQVSILRKRPVLMFTVKLDWHEKDRLLKAEFNTNITAEKVISDIPYGAIERPVNPYYPAEKARWEMPCQKWIDLSDGDCGLALINQNKYGFSASGGTYALTLLRSPKHPGPVRGAWGLRPDDQRPQYTDQGEHLIRYALFPHRGDWRDAAMWQIGHEFCDPLLVVRTDHHKGFLPREATTLSCRSSSTYVGAIKRPEDNPDKADTKYHQVVVRLVEAAGRPDSVTLSFSTRMTITDAKETDLLEFTTGAVSDTDVEKGKVILKMNPFEIKTVKITLKNAERGN